MKADKPRFALTHPSSRTGPGNGPCRSRRFRPVRGSTLAPNAAHPLTG